LAGMPISWRPSGPGSSGREPPAGRRHDPSAPRSQPFSIPDPGSCTLFPHWHSRHPSRSPRHSSGAFRLSSVDSRDVHRSDLPVFRRRRGPPCSWSSMRPPPARSRDPRRPVMVDEFPLESGRARPSTPAHRELPPLAERRSGGPRGRYHFDPERFLAAHPSLPRRPSGPWMLQHRAAARGKESVRTCSSRSTSAGDRRR